MNGEKLKFVKIERYDGDKYIGSYIQTAADAHVLLDEINESDDGRWFAQVVWLTQAEYDAMPEFQGY